MAPPCSEVRPSSGPPTMRLVIAWVYSWPTMLMSKLPSVHGA